MSNNRLYVGNLPYSVTELELRDLFGEIGSVAEVKVVMDRETGRPRGFGFVEMSSSADAQKAIEQLNGRDLQGRRSPSKRPRPARAAAVAVDSAVAVAASAAVVAGVAAAAAASAAAAAGAADVATASPTTSR